MEKAPDSWVNVALSEVVAINPGIDKSRFSDDDELPFVPMPAVEAGTGKIDTSEIRPFKKVKSGFTAFASGDVLFAKITPCMENGKMALVPDLPEGVGFGTTEFHVLRPTKAVDARLLYYFVSSASVRHEAQHNMTGAVGQKRVPKRFLELKEFPLPPLNEQHRIVEKIETLFARIDKGEEALREVQKLLKRYRQSILKAAVTGELTRDWREANQHKLEPASDILARILESRRENWQGPGKYKAPNIPDTANLPELPEGWVWAPLEGLCMPRKHALKAGPFGSALKKSDYSASGYKIYGQEQVIGGDWTIGDYFIDEEKYQELQNCSVSPRDVLISLVGTIGKVLILPPECAPGIINPRLVKVSLEENVYLPEFFKLYFESSFLKALYKLDAHGATMDVLNLGIIRKLPYPLCSPEEQKLIVDRATEALESAAALEVWCQAELKRSNALRQSILKSAFSGQLVPQDPDDEPASELLTRIRAEREEVTKKRSKKKASRKKTRAKA